jgi:hypothetical protein
LGFPARPALFLRLCRETTLSIKAIAARVHSGSSKAANAKLHNHLHRSPVPDSAQPQLAI